MIPIVYLSDDTKLDYIMSVTGLSLDELEHVVGRFDNHAKFGNSLKGELYQTNDGDFVIKHHFSKKVLWSNK